MKLSKSKVNSYLKCPLEFKFQYIDEIEMPQNQYMALGSDVHQVAGDPRVGAPAQEHPRPPQIRPDHLRAGGALPGQDRGGEAGGGLAAVIHRAEAVRKPLQEGPVPLVVAGVEGHRGGAGFLFDPAEPGGDLRQRLLPGDGLNLSGPPGSRPAQGRLHPVGPVDVVPHGKTPGAELSVIYRVIVGALHLDDGPVFHIAGHAAVGSRCADVAEAVPETDPGVRSGKLCPSPLAKIHILTSKRSFFYDSKPFHRKQPSFPSARGFPSFIPCIFNRNNTKEPLTNASLWYILYVRVFWRRNKWISRKTNGGVTNNGKSRYPV